MLRIIKPWEIKKWSWNLTLVQKLTGLTITMWAKTKWRFAYIIFQINSSTLIRQWIIRIELLRANTIIKKLRAILWINFKLKKGIIINSKFVKV